MASDKLTNKLVDLVDKTLDVYAEEMATRTARDIVVQVLSKAFGMDRHGFRAGYGSSMVEFIDWFMALPGIRERVTKLVDDLMSTNDRDKTRLEVMRKFLQNNNAFSYDRYSDDWKRILEPFRVYARIRARQDAQAIWEAARDHALIAIATRETSPPVPAPKPVPVKKSPSRRKKSCSDAQDVVQET